MGCSKQQQNVAKWDHGQIIADKEPINVSEYTGSDAYYEEPMYSFRVYECPEGYKECGHNSLGVAPDLMTKHKNGVRYYTGYNDTVLWMFYPKGDSWVEMELDLNVGEVMPVGQMVDIGMNVLSKIKLYPSTSKVVINDAVEVDTEFYTYKMTPSYVNIDGYCKIGTNTGSITMSDSYTLDNGKVVAYTTKGSYDYYLYEDVIIEAAQGIDINQFIKFL